MDKFKLISQIDILLAQYGGMKSQATLDDLSDLDREPNAFVVRARAAIERIAPGDNSYTKELARVEGGSPSYRIRIYVGILEALRADLLQGWLEGVTELVHAETFGDFLEQASELLSKHYKGPAAVVVGSTLESHIRLLAKRFGIETKLPSDQPKKADTLNADLVKASAYNNLQQKAVTAWLGIRNAAAHGEHDKYDERQVADMLSGVRDFMARYPA